MEEKPVAVSTWARLRRSSGGRSLMGRPGRMQAGRSDGKQIAASAQIDHPEQKEKQETQRESKPP